MISSSEYHSYYESYVAAFTKQSKSVMESLQISRDRLLELMNNLPKEKETYRYKEGKWTLKELMQHIIDTERIFQYRALRIARNDQNDLLGFDQDKFNANSNANSRELSLLLEEFKSVRNATTTLFNSFDDHKLNQIGKASGNEISVRAIGYIIAGHQQHHLEVFKEQYL